MKARWSKQASWNSDGRSFIIVNLFLFARNSDRSGLVKNLSFAIKNFQLLKVDNKRLKRNSRDLVSLMQICFLSIIDDDQNENESKIYLKQARKVGLEPTKLAKLLMLNSQLDFSNLCEILGLDSEGNGMDSDSAEIIAIYFVNFVNSDKSDQFLGIIPNLLPKLKVFALKLSVLLHMAFFDKNDSSKAIFLLQKLIFLRPQKKMQISLLIDDLSAKWFLALVLNESQNF